MSKHLARTTCHRLTAQVKRTSNRHLLERAGVLEERVGDGGPLQPAAEIQNSVLVNDVRGQIAGEKGERKR